MSDSLTITFQNESVSKNVTLVVKDYLTEAAIPLAAVTISGPSGYSYSGSTDAEGRIILGTLKPGQYNLVATATGYQSSADDILANDRFTI